MMRTNGERDTLSGIDLEDYLAAESEGVRLLARYVQRSHEAIVRIEGYAYRCARDAAATRTELADTRSELEPRIARLESRAALVGASGAGGVLLIAVLVAPLLRSLLGG